MHSNDKLVEDFAKYLYKQIWPTPWEKLNEDETMKKHWRNEAKDYIEFLKNKGFVLKVEG